MGGISISGGALGAPLYKEVKRKLTESLRAGEWKPGEVIPAEKRLAERFGVSIGTVRKAVDELAAESILIRHQGRGTFVAQHSQDRYLFTFFHVAGQDGQKEYPQVELIEFGKAKADAYSAAKLGLAPDARLFRFVNRLALGGAPVIVDEVLLPERLFTGLSERRLRERSGTLYRLYQDEFGVTVVRTEERLRAVKVEPLQAGLLGIARSEPLLLAIRCAYSFRDQPVELRRSYIDTRRHEYVVEPAAPA